MQYIHKYNYVCWAEIRAFSVSSANSAIIYLSWKRLCRLQSTKYNPINPYNNIVDHTLHCGNLPRLRARNLGREGG